MTLSNAELTHKVANLTETQGYILDALTDLRTEQRRQGQRLTHVERDVAGLKTDVADIKTDVAGLKTDVAGLKVSVTEIKGSVTEILRRLPVPEND